MLGRKYYVWTWRVCYNLFKVAYLQVFGLWPTYQTTSRYFHWPPLAGKLLMTSAFHFVCVTYYNLNEGRQLLHFPYWLMRFDVTLMICCLFYWWFLCFFFTHFPFLFEFTMQVFLDD